MKSMSGKSEGSVDDLIFCHLYGVAGDWYLSEISEDREKAFGFQIINSEPVWEMDNWLINSRKWGEIPVKVLQELVNEKFLKEINLNECNPICVILIDNATDIGYLDRLCEIGYKGVMLDTINKERSRVFDQLSEKECISFVRESRKLGMTSGLAGSLTLGDLPKLSKINSDFIGFRGQLCEKQSNRFSLDRNAVIKLLGSTHLSPQ